MATAVVEIGAEGAEALAPEAEEVGAKVAPKLEEVGSKAASKVERLFGKKAATEAAEVGTEEAASAATEEAAAAAEKPAGRQTMDRLMDVGTGVMIGQSLQGSDSGSKAAQGATQTLAAVQAPPGAALAPPAAATGAAERRRDARGRFVRGGKDDDDDEVVSIPGMVVGTIFADKDDFTAACAAKSGSGQPRRLHRGGFDLGDDDDLAADADFAAETQDSTSYFSAPAATGGAGETPATVVVHKHPRPLAESFQIAILIVLVIIVIAVTITISVKKPSSISSFGYGMLLGVASGATVYWVLNSRAGRPKSA